MYRPNKKAECQAKGIISRKEHIEEAIDNNLHQDGAADEIQTTKKE